MTTETRYNAALDYLYSFVDYSLKHASELAKADFNLDRMVALMQQLGNPQHDYKVIHVAGTKGKGSTSALVASALQAAGYRTGLYTSPHLQDYAERIQVDGQSIPHDALANLVDEIKPAVAAVPYLTTFEITTALGFLYFARQGCETAVIEVGLGGRLDATNIVTPLVSVITSISYDHTAVLGNTLTLIAGEKAGIIKPGAPVVVAPQVEEARLVFERVAAERHSPLTLVEREVVSEVKQQSLDGQEITFQASRFNIQKLDLMVPLLGAHQRDNAATALAALRVADQTGLLPVSLDAIKKGFAAARWPCRFEVMRREPPIILDSAHNEDSFRKLDATLEEFFPGRKVVLILGVSEDKHLHEMLTVMGPRLAMLLATRADHPRALSAEAVAETARQAGVRSQTVTPVSAALVRALEISTKDGSIVISAGSMFVTAEAKTAWQRLNSGESP